jgi:hypothetical protein
MSNLFQSKRLFIRSWTMYVCQSITTLVPNGIERGAAIVIPSTGFVPDAVIVPAQYAVTKRLVRRIIYLSSLIVVPFLPSQITLPFDWIFGSYFDLLAFRGRRAGCVGSSSCECDMSVNPRIEYPMFFMLF